MKIELGKFYKTSGGKKAEALRKTKQNHFLMWCEDEGFQGHFYVTPEGKNQYGNSQFDIVSEWRDPIEVTISENELYYLGLNEKALIKKAGEKNFSNHIKAKLVFE